MERHEEKRDHPHWKRGQRTQPGFSERHSSGQRDDRKNWGDEHRQVFLPRRVQEQTERRSDRNDSRVFAHRPVPEGLRGQCRIDQKEKDPTRDPKTQDSSSSAKEDRGTWRTERISSLEKRTETPTCSKRFFWTEGTGMMNAGRCSIPDEIRSIEDLLQ
ncbi:hypothetical protein MHYP_G00170830 [Metynnis hypsauchen]